MATKKTTPIKTVRRSFLVCAGMILLGCAPETASQLTVDIPAAKDRLAPCPNTPNCVSSMELTGSRYIPPFTYTVEKDVAYQRLVEIIASDPRARIVAKQANYLRAEYRSAIFGFVDDVEFLFSFDEPTIELRSASRVGYYDFGVNRRRIEKIRNSWDDGLRP